MGGIPEVKEVDEWPKDYQIESLANGELTAGMLSESRSDIQ